MKIVLSKHIEYNFDAAWVIGFDKSVEDVMPDGYVQTSEVIDVEFTMLEVDFTAEKVKVIDERISKAEAGIYLLKREKAELLSIPDMRAE